MNKLLTLTAITLLTIGLHHLQSENTVDYQLRFEGFAAQYGKTYSTPAEKQYRQQVFEQNLREIEAHNADPTQTSTFGITKFSDLTQEEFETMYLTRKSFKYEDLEEYVPTQAPAASADWSNLTRIKDQGQCGSCWAFSAVGAVESFFRVNKDKNTPDLSEQQLVDCDTSSYGCDGGFENLGIKWASKNGLQTGAAYPYKGVDQTCQFKTGSYKPTGYKAVSASNMQSAITTYPITVAVDATNWNKYSDTTKPFNNCGKNLNHAVLAVGFYADGTWLIKNSWGTDWGKSGFIVLAAGNTCGVQNEAYQAY